MVAMMYPVASPAVSKEGTAMEKREMEEVWKAHTDAEFLKDDVEAALATMTEDAFVENVPTGMGGRRKKSVRAFLPGQFRKFITGRHRGRTQASCRR